MSWCDLHEGILEEFVEAGRLRDVGTDEESPWEERKRYFAEVRREQSARCLAKKSKDPVWKAAHLAKKRAWSKANPEKMAVYVARAKARRAA